MVRQAFDSPVVHDDLVGHRVDERSRAVVQVDVGDEAQPVRREAGRKQRDRAR